MYEHSIMSDTQHDLKTDVDVPQSNNECNRQQCTKTELINQIKGLENYVQTLMDMVQQLNSQVHSSGMQIANMFQQNKKERINAIMVANDLAQENIGDTDDLMKMSSEELAVIQQQVLASYVQKLKKMRG